MATTIVIHDADGQGYLAECEIIQPANVDATVIYRTRSVKGKRQAVTKLMDLLIAYGELK